MRNLKRLDFEASAERGLTNPIPLLTLESVLFYGFQIMINAAQPNFFSD